MSNMAPAYVTLNPSFTLPEIIMPYTQASSAFELLSKGAPEVRLGEGDQVVYANRADVRTKAAAGQFAYNELPSATVIMSQVSTATYLIRTRGEYDHHDSAAMARRGVNVTNALRLANRQAHFQLSRVGLLYGFNPANGEGLITAPNALSINLPPDSNGNDTAITYDNGEFGLFIALAIGAIKQRTNQLGKGRKFTMVGPQRVMQLFEYNVVQLVQFQRAGAGADSTKGMLDSILMKNGDELIWGYDDTLQGKGAGGTDMIAIGMPEVESLKQSAWNTNEFADLTPSLDACLLQLADMAAPREITVPLPGGAVDTVYEMRVTSGWPVRPEALTLLSLAFQ